MTLVRGVTASATREASMLYERGSMSTKTGRAPRRAIAAAVAKNENGVVITSSPDLTSRAIKASSSPSEPEAQPTAYFALQYSAIEVSSWRTSSPRTKRCEASTRSTARCTPSRIEAYCDWRSSKGTFIEMIWNRVRANHLSFVIYHFFGGRRSSKWHMVNVRWQMTNDSCLTR